MSRLRLDYAARKRGAVVTEGPSDDTILSSVLGLDRRTLFAAGGRANVLRCAESLGNRALDGVVCVADRDFDMEETDWADTWWLVFYDDADVEAMLIESESLTRFLAEWASKRKLEKIGDTNDVRTLLRERATPMSALRSVNARDKIGIPIDSVELADIVDKKIGEIKIPSLIGRLVAGSSISHDQLKNALEDECPVCPHTSQPLARGRDLMGILTALLRHILGSLSKQQVAGGFVERSMRLAAQEGDFDGTPFKSRFEAALKTAVAAV